MLIFEGEPWQAMIVVSIAERIEVGTCPSSHCLRITRESLGPLVVELAFDFASCTSLSTPFVGCCYTVTFSANTEHLVARGRSYTYQTPLYHD